ncbi:MAG: UDP-N-acetylglucosamine 1-carboxyvinyltransferase [Ruminococcaceae bacterium]|nr:UDP-N-acetylglucosamine 1-carboxyvinyltransferase [Oscillospiraceae bacterium]
MEKFVINGGTPLFGEVNISGAKNAAVAIIPAAILIEDECIIENVPDIKDVRIILDMLCSMGAKVEKIDANTVKIDATSLDTYIVGKEKASKMRASYYMLGALCSRFKKAVVPPPGGCNFGIRPIDQHIKGFEALNCKTEIKHGNIELDASDIKGGQVYFDVVSVGATINIMLAAVKAPGVTIMENAAKEPHIVDVANFLNSMGANIKGAGTDVIKITGVEKLHGGVYGVIPDQIEAGSYMFAAAATRGDVTIKNVIPKHLDAITSKFVEMGVDVEEGDDYVRVNAKGALNKINVKTLPYPGFPTDLQPPMVALLTTVSGTSIVTESVWDSRFQYVSELEKMGAKITVNGQVAVVEGGKSLTGADVCATDLRAGAGMIIAALSANGKSSICNIHHIDRGYENIEQKLISLGAKIIRTDD